MTSSSCSPPADSTTSAGATSVEASAGFEGFAVPFAGDFEEGVTERV